MFKLGVIGAGHMGMAILDAVIEHNLAAPSDILAYDIAPERSREAKGRGFAVAGNEAEVYANCQLLMLAVSPQVCEALLVKLAKSAIRLEKKPIIINIMAGISSNYIRTHLKDIAVITIMPTMGMKVGQGAAAIAYTDNVADSELSYVMKIFYATGEVVIAEESLLKEIVAVNGCMPGYVFYMLEAFAKEAERQGIDFQTALRMTARGFIGAAQQVLEGAAPKEMIAKVCTPGGLTAKGVESFEANHLDKILAEGMNASIKRGYELAR